MDLVVVRGFHPAGVEDTTTVQHQAIHRAAHGQRATHHPQAVLASRLSQKGLDGRGAIAWGFGQRQLVGVAPAQDAKVLRQQHQLRARRCSLPHQALGAVAVAGPVGSGHHLQGGDLHTAHGKRQGKADIPRLAWAMQTRLTSANSATPARQR